MNKLYFGDNLDVLREKIKDESVDIIYLEAEMGVLVSLADPTGPMKTEADAAGFVRKSAHGRLPRMQIVTIEDMLANRLPKPLPQPAQKMPTARKRASPDQLELLLPFEGTAIKSAAGEFIDPKFDPRLAAAE